MPVIIYFDHIRYVFVYLTIIIVIISCTLNVTLAHKGESSFVHPSNHRSRSVKDDDHETDEAVSFYIPQSCDPSLESNARVSKGIRRSFPATQRPRLRIHYISNGRNNSKFGDFEAFSRS